MAKHSDTAARYGRRAALAALPLALIASLAVPPTDIAVHADVLSLTRVGAWHRPDNAAEAHAVVRTASRTRAAQEAMLIGTFGIGIGALVLVRRRNAAVQRSDPPLARNAG